MQVEIVSMSCISLCLARRQDKTDRPDGHQNLVPRLPIHNSSIKNALLSLIRISCQAMGMSSVSQTHIFIDVQIHLCNESMPSILEYSIGYM
jgi:hypothetical protein